MLEYIVPALQNLINIENLIWINLGVFIGSVFAAIPGLSVILCIILFLPFTYQMTAIPGMMFLLGSFHIASSIFAIRVRSRKESPV